MKTLKSHLAPLSFFFVGVSVLGVIDKTFFALALATTLGISQFLFILCMDRDQADHGVGVLRTGQLGTDRLQRRDTQSVFGL